MSYSVACTYHHAFCIGSTLYNMTQFVQDDYPNTVLNVETKTSTSKSDRMVRGIKPMELALRNALHSARTFMIMSTFTVETIVSPRKIERTYSQGTSVVKDRSRDERRLVISMNRANARIKGFSGLGGLPEILNYSFYLIV